MIMIVNKRFWALSYLFCWIQISLLFFSNKITLLHSTRHCKSIVQLNTK